MDTVSGEGEAREYASVILRRAAFALAPMVALGWAHGASLALALAVGGVFSLVKFRVRVHLLTRIQAGSPKQAFSRTWFLSLVFYVSTGILFAVAALHPGIQLAGVVMGSLLTNATVAAERIVPWLRVVPASPLDAAP